MGKPHQKWEHLRKLSQVLPATTMARLVDITHNGADRYTIDICLPGRGPRTDNFAWSTHFLNGFDEASVALFLLQVP